MLRLHHRAHFATKSVIPYYLSLPGCCWCRFSSLNATPLADGLVLKKDSPFIGDFRQVCYSKEEPIPKFEYIFEVWNF